MLSDEPGVWVYILADPSRHMAVEVAFHKWKLMPEPLRTRLRKIEEEAERGAVSAADGNLFRREMATMVRILLDPEASGGFIALSTLPYGEFASRYPDLASHGHQ